MKAALLLIDIQNDYFPGGKMVLEGSLEASQKANRILAFFREKDLPMVHIQHISTRPGASFFITGTEGVKIHPNVEPAAGERVICKHFPNSFRETPLLEHLKTMSIDHVVIAGMMTHMCVDATVRTAFDYGFRCTVLHDACAARTLSFNNQTVPATQVHAAFMAALSPVYAQIVSTDDCIAKMG
jgi:nicotinamidase-related amidase